MSKLIWTDEMRAQLAGMKRAGLTTAVIAKRFGVTPRAIKHQCSKQRALVPPSLGRTRGRLAFNRLQTGENNG